LIALRTAASLGSVQLGFKLQFAILPSSLKAKHWT